MLRGIGNVVGEETSWPAFNLIYDLGVRWQYVWLGAYFRIEGDIEHQMIYSRLYWTIIKAVLSQISGISEAALLGSPVQNDDQGDGQIKARGVMKERSNLK